jgi:hypothetical protein
LGEKLFYKKVFPPNPLFQKFLQGGERNLKLSCHIPRKERINSFFSLSFGWMYHFSPNQKFLKDGGLGEENFL